MQGMIQNILLKGCYWVRQVKKHELDLKIRWCGIQNKVP